MVDWRWRRLFCVVQIAWLDDEREALWRTAALLRAKLHVDKKFEEVHP